MATGGHFTVGFLVRDLCMLEWHCLDELRSMSVTCACKRPTQKSIERDGQNKRDNKEKEKKE
jgi:hypothetical protein